MTADRVRVGVIGVGRMGERHCRVYSTLAHTELVGVSDPRPERGLAVADAYGVAWYPDYRELLPRVDAVSIATPTDRHFPIAADCIRRGIHVLVEKPMTAGLDEARELVCLARDSRVVLQAGHIERFNPAFLELQSILEDMEVVALSARRLSPSDTSNTDVDVVFDLMVHDIDLAVTLLGREFRELQACGRSAVVGSPDFVVASLISPGGAIATLTASRLTEHKVRQIEVTAVGAYIEADLLNQSICIFRRTLPEYLANQHRPPRYRQENIVERIYIPTAEPLLLELQDFVRCVREGRSAKVSGEDALAALELAEAIRRCVQGRRAPPELAMTP